MGLSKKAQIITYSILFFASFCHKRKRGFTGAAPPLLRAKHGNSARSAVKKEKGAKGVWVGETNVVCLRNEEFSPTAISPLKISFPQKQSSGLFLNSNLKMLKAKIFTTLFFQNSPPDCFEV